MTFGILYRRLEGILNVGEGAIVTATRLLWERAKLVVEASRAVPLAAILEHPETFRARRVSESSFREAT